MYPLDSYKIGQKEERVEKDANIAARFSRMYVTHCILLFKKMTGVHTIPSTRMSAFILELIFICIN